MCIAHSVGLRGANHHADVKTIQVFLNLNNVELTPLALLKEDGKMGPGTIAAIEEFQRRVLNMSKPKGRVEPDSETLRKLREGLPEELTEDMLGGIFPGAGLPVIRKYFAPLTAGMDSAKIATPLRMAHFLAQIGHESVDMRYAEEIASGAAYEGRQDLGNTQPGDGKRFKGRGLIQLTGRAHYTEYGNFKGRDFLTGNNPSLIASDPFLAVDASCWFWTTHQLNDLSDADDLRAVTKVISGGYNGLQDRQARLARAKCFLVR